MTDTKGPNALTVIMRPDEFSGGIIKSKLEETRDIT